MGLTFGLGLRAGKLKSQGVKKIWKGVVAYLFYFEYCLIFRIILLIKRWVKEKRLVSNDDLNVEEKIWDLDYEQVSRSLLHFIIGLIIFHLLVSFYDSYWIKISVDPL